MLSVASGAVHQTETPKTPNAETSTPLTAIYQNSWLSIPSTLSNSLDELKAYANNGEVTLTFRGSTNTSNGWLSGEAPTEIKIDNTICEYIEKHEQESLEPKCKIPKTVEKEDAKDRPLSRTAKAVSFLCSSNSNSESQLEKTFDKKTLEDEPTTLTDIQSYYTFSNVEDTSSLLQESSIATDPLIFESKDNEIESIENEKKVPYYMLGFPNPPGENRCWLNATLHALFALPLTDVMKKSVENMHECSELTKTLIAIQMHWKKGVPGKQKTWQMMKTFKEQLSNLDESYPSERQQDVSEFLMIYLNYIKMDFEKQLKADAVSNETENIPENESSPRRIAKVSQTPKRRPPLADISPHKRSLKRGPLFMESNSSPKTRKAELSGGMSDLLTPKVGRFSNPSDLSYKVHTPPQHPENNKEIEVYDNPIDEYFLLYMMEHYMCKSCKKVRQKKVDNLMLYVDLPSENEEQPVCLETAIKKNFASEERTLKCGTCGFNTQTMRTTFRRRPRIVMTQINRYGITSEGTIGKINTPVEVPESLTLEFTPGTEKSVETDTYKPVCIISHIGSTMDCGHYTSYVKRNDQWFHYNDMKVSEKSFEEALTASRSTAYIVFFMNTRLEKEMSNSLKNDIE